MHVLPGRFQVTKSTRAHGHTTSGRQPRHRGPQARANRWQVGGRPLDPSASPALPVAISREESAPDCPSSILRANPPKAPSQFALLVRVGGTPLTRKVRDVSSSPPDNSFCLSVRSHKRGGSGRRAWDAQKFKTRRASRPILIGRRGSRGPLESVTVGCVRVRGAPTFQLRCSPARPFSFDSCVASAYGGLCGARKGKCSHRPFLSGSRRRAYFLCVVAPLQQRTKQPCLFL